MPTRIEKLASNQTMYYRGDTCIEISPFTNYYMFTIYRESNDAKVDDHVPLNLTNLGTIWMSFISGETKIRVPNYTDAENVDMANGEVVFRISDDEAGRILALSNHTFYISSAITDGKSSSDETVLFSGSWNEYSTAMRSSLTETIQSLNSTITDLKNKIATDTDAWNVRLTDLENENANLKSEIERLNAQITELESKLAEMDVEYIEATIVNDSDSDNGRTIPKELPDSEVANMEYSASKLEVSTTLSKFRNRVITKNGSNTAGSGNLNTSSGSNSSGGTYVNSGKKKR